VSTGTIPTPDLDQNEGGTEQKETGHMQTCRPL
jgi:hypothetical protein